MIRTVSIGIFFLALSLLSIWLVVHNGHLRTIFHKTYTFTDSDVKKFKHHPRFLYLYGLNAWFQNDSKTAGHFFRKTVLQNVLHMDAWIRLSQTELVLGNTDSARAIATFLDPMTEKVYRWKWRQTLLAYDLGLRETIIRNVNFLVNHQKMIQDAFQLLDTQVSKSTAETVAVLDSDNLIPLLKWLMRWDRVDDAEIVWDRITKPMLSEEGIILKYIHFLINKKRVQKAADIWRSHTGIDGLANAGFEKEITGLGFDWRYTPDRANKWTIRRTTSRALHGTHSLKVVFEGKENISFAHLYQIATVDPLKTYRLTYNWSSSDISTDQGPFTDIYGYDCSGFYLKGPMIFGTNDWEEQHLEFTVPENCHAIVIRLRRQASHRFDNKISGTLWLDNFRLEEVETPIPPDMPNNVSGLGPHRKKIDKRIQI